MLGYRVCWQLLLGWALLLGQPVSGDSDAAEELPLAESEDVVPIAQEPEEPVPESQAAESVPEPQELEEPVSELQDPEDLVPVSENAELEEIGLPVTKSKERTSDEVLESSERQERESLLEDLSSPWHSDISRMQRVALEHHHKHSEDFYKPYEKANLITEKAHGTLIYLKMDMVKTNCTNDRRPKEDESDYSYYHRLYHADRYPRNCEPLNNKKQKCKFTFYEDTKNPGEPIVINGGCYEMFESEEDFSRGALLQDK